MTTLFLIRHALTPDVGNRLSGRNLQVGLSALGKEQAVALPSLMAPVSLDVLYSSPQTRALETARPLAEAKQLAVNINPAFDEIDFGDWTGQEFASLAGDAGFGLFNSFRSHFRVPGGETMTAAQVRMLQGIEQLINLHSGKRIGIVSHSDMIKATLCFYLGMPIDQMQRIEVLPASVSGIILYPETARVFLINHCGTINNSLD